MNLLKTAVEFQAAKDAAKPVVKLSLVAKIKAVYRNWKGKRAWEALKVAKREEKAVQAKTKAEQADEMETRSNALIEQSVLCKDKVEANRLFEEAVELAQAASSLRFN